MIIFAVASALVGCGDGKPSVDTSMTEATVSGIVTVKGTPATGGRISFNPSNSGRIVPARVAEIGPDGSYTIKTLTGDNRVTFDGEVAAKNKGIGLLRESATVERGENRVNFDLMGEGSKRISYDLTKKAASKGRH